MIRADICKTLTIAKECRVEIIIKTFILSTTSRRASRVRLCRSGDGRDTVKDGNGANQQQIAATFKTAG
jgi:hypothetical protein